MAHTYKPSYLVTEAEIQYRLDLDSKTLPQKKKKNAKNVVWW